MQGPLQWLVSGSSSQSNGAYRRQTPASEARVCSQPRRPERRWRWCFSLLGALLSFLRRSSLHSAPEPGREHEGKEALLAYGWMREAKRAPRSANRPTLTEILQSLLKMMPAMWVFDLAAVTKVLTRIRNPGGLSVNAGTKGDCTRKYTRIELGVYM